MVQKKSSTTSSVKPHCNDDSMDDSGDVADSVKLDSFECSSPPAASFASSTLPPGIGLESSCQLPFGFVWTPLRRHQQKQEVDRRCEDSSAVERLSSLRMTEGSSSFSPCNSELCLTCLSYRNEFSALNVTSEKWTCSICGQSQNEVLWRPRAALAARTAPRCAEIESNWWRCRQPMGSSGHRRVDVQSLALVLDENLTAMEAHAVLRCVQEVVHEMLLECSGKGSNGIALTSATRDPTDSSDPADYSRLVLHISLLVFGKFVTIYQLGLCCNSSSAASADVVRTHEGLALGGSDRMRQRSYHMTLTSSSASLSPAATATLLEPLVTCISAHFGTATGTSVVPILKFLTTTDQNTHAGINAGINASTNTKAADSDEVRRRMINSSSTSFGTEGLLPQKSRMEILKERKEARIREQEQKQQQQQQQLQQNQFFYENHHEANHRSDCTESQPQSSLPVLESPFLKVRRTHQSNGQINQVFSNSSSNKSNLPTSISESKPQWRCTGEVMECAMDLAACTPSYPFTPDVTCHKYRSNYNDDTTEGAIKTASSRAGNVRTGRILLFTNGCPNYGLYGSCVDSAAVANLSSSLHPNMKTVNPHKLAEACEYYESLGKYGTRSCSATIGIDVFCSGSAELAVPAYQALVDASSGYVLSLDSFYTNEYQLKRNLQQIFLRTYMQSAQYQCDSTSLIATNATTSRHATVENDYHNNNIQDVNSSEGLIDAVTIDIRTSSFLTITHLIGPGELLSLDDHNNINHHNRDGSTESTLIEPLLPNERPTYQLCKQALAGNHLHQNNKIDNQEHHDNRAPFMADSDGDVESGNNPAVEKYSGRSLSPTKKKITIELDEFMLESSLIRIRLGRYDPNATFSAMVRLNDFYQRKHDSHGYIQTTIRYLNQHYGSRTSAYDLVTEIVTYQLPIAKTTTEYIQSIALANPKVIPVLLAKEAVYRSIHGGGSEGRRDNLKRGSALASFLMFGRGVGNKINKESTAVAAGQNQRQQLQQQSSSMQSLFSMGVMSIVDDLSFEAQRDLDETIYRISRSYRLLCLENGASCCNRGCSSLNGPPDEELGSGSTIRTGGSSINTTAAPAFLMSAIDVAFPMELSNAIRALYHLRRGPLLCPGPIQSDDDRTELRSLFLRLPLDDCYDMLAPQLWSCAVLKSAPPPISTSASNIKKRFAAPYMEEVPPETLALWSDRIIACDHFHNLFVWSGADVIATASTDVAISAAVEAVREYLINVLLERSEHRFPAPNLHVVSENNSMSRRFTSLLGPSHGDPIEHQMAHFPALALQLSEQELERLRSKFHFSHNSSSSDPSFRNWFWNVTSAIGQRTQDIRGESLCD